MCFGRQPSWCHFVAERDDRGRERRRKNGETAKNQEVSLTRIMYTPFPPQKGNPLGQTKPFSCPWPEGRRCRGAARTPAHSPYSATRKITRRPTGSLQGGKHEIPTQMGGMDVVMTKGEVPAITHSDRL